jgi:hypothetical protein
VYQNVIIPYLYEAQHVLGGSPPIIRLLMMGGESPKTCSASYKYGIIKCWYIVASCWIFLYELQNLASNRVCTCTHYAHCNYTPYLNTLQFSTFSLFFQRTVSSHENNRKHLDPVFTKFSLKTWVHECTNQYFFWHCIQISPASTVLNIRRTTD